MSSSAVDAPGQPEVRITTGSGSINVIAEARANVVAEGRVDVQRAADGAVEVVPQKGSRSMTVRCPEGSSVTVGTRSGSLQLEGRFGAVRATTLSGSIAVDTAQSVDARAMSGKITIGACSGACRLKTKSGSIRLKSAGSAEVHIGSGSVNLDHVEGSVVARAVSGSVTVDAGAAGPVLVETMSGSITVTLPPNCRPNVRAKSMSSRPRVECESGDDCDVKVRTMSGGISVRCR